MKAQKGDRKGVKKVAVQEKFAPFQFHFLSICIYGLVIRNSNFRVWNHVENWQKEWLSNAYVLRLSDIFDDLISVFFLEFENFAKISKKNYDANSLNAVERFITDIVNIINMM